MANHKTHLRELGVAVATHLLLRNLGEKFNKLTPKQFYKFSEVIIHKNELEKIKGAFQDDTFSDSEKDILKNCFNLSKAIVSSFNLKEEDKIIWCGNDSQNTLPIDLIIGKHFFSLKEESFILENMGLYKYLNLVTGLEFERGTHIFEKFGSVEYEKFFSFVWNTLLDEHKNFLYTGSSYKSKIDFIKESVVLTYDSENTKISSVLPIKKTLTIKEFTNLTTSITREKVFSKWIKNVLERKTEYLSIKKSTSEYTANELVKFLIKNKDQSYLGLKRFLRLHEQSYYYAKSVKDDVKIYRVPSAKEFENVFTIDEISYKVPESQINIYTKIKNKVNGEVLILRNELRFSHGQFNGTPEAKMYYDKNSSLETIYEKIF